MTKTNGSAGKAARKKKPTQTLYKRLGGAKALAAVVEDFYERVLGDDALAGFFSNVDMDRQRKQQTAFMAAAFGGPNKYNGLSMTEAHEGLGISQGDFDAVATHLVESLESFEVDEKLIQEVVGIVAPLSGAIVDDSAQEGMMMGSGNDQGGRFFDMIENAPVNVIYCEKDTFEIKYLNETSITTLATLEQYLPCRAEDIQGKCIDIFHKDPSVQRRVLSDPSNLPYRTHIELGPETLDLLVTGITDENGEHQGWMVTWEVVTAKLDLERRMAQVSSMMENAPVNVIYADKETATIQYLNPASVNTLKALEQYLPCKLDELEGQCIDVFHKDPSVQRRIISDPSNLPHRTQIQVGPETLELLVSAIFDNSGDYMGPMVTWEIITERLRLQEEREESRQREQAQAEEVRSKVDSLLAVVEAASAGDLTQEVTVSGDDPIGKMGEALERLLMDFRRSIGAIGEHAQSLGSASEELTAVSQQMSGNAEETTSQAKGSAEASDRVSQSVQTVAAAAEEMNASIKEIAVNAQEAAKVANAAVDVAESANTTVSKLGESSAEIGQVIKVITSIAQQTNLLALNATIEAARAGEAGKGFAVVANEVKELAKETAKATEDIGQKIEAIQGDTKSAVTAIGEISGIIDKINNISSTIASAVEEQSATTSEIGRSVTDAATGTSEIVQKIQLVAETAESTSSGASDTQKAAEELSSLATELQSVISAFQV